jgi:type I pantothenate kinase
MKRKGFPESYDVRRLVRFLAEVKAGKSPVWVPVYSHLLYDIVPEQQQVIEQPDILIVEGLNILQGEEQVHQGQYLLVSGFFDFTIYLDAEESDIEQWYIQRFLLLCQTAPQDPSSYFTHFAHLNGEEAVQTACRIWQEINCPNLRENILPMRERADVIIRKGAHHLVQEIRLRNL